jgi:hypothetical protein
MSIAFGQLPKRYQLIVFNVVPVFLGLTQNAPSVVEIGLPYACTVVADTPSWARFA